MNKRNREMRFRQGDEARKEVERRVILAIGRLNVTLEFDEGSASVVPQTLHAIHYLERGWAGKSTQELNPAAPDFHTDRETAEHLAVHLARMLADARRATTTVEEEE